MAALCLLMFHWATVQQKDIVCSNALGTREFSVTVFWRQACEWF